MPSDQAPVLVLASASPRRRDLLARIGVVPARIVAPDVDETPLKGERPRDYVRRVAAAKANAVERTPGEVILAADTTIAVGRRILGKPADAGELRWMLGLLAGRRHHCLSSVAVIDAAGRLREQLSDTLVVFKPLSTAEIDAYVAGGEGMGKAGGYAIQGHAETWVRRLDGSHSGVVGLPLYETAALLRTAGIRLG
ncbi:nucleoside triphosphate pyrophosphatase [uncultured Sphingomonas sp.]|uniref:Maf family protein n=1 Tax=uncultured Sphingomonas sp. TaxID=158754 RepID=UPI002610AA3E|nr:nucleoside triphosphate pyrophosphatase [uncultured Sphingomonas sp.]